MNNDYIPQSREETREEKEKAARRFINAVLAYNTDMSDEECEKNAPPAPHTRPDVTVKLPSPGVVELHICDSESERRAKPDGVYGAEIIWAILDTPPTGWKQLIHSSFCILAPLRLSFEDKERGKTLYFALRWKNTRSEKGPWTEIFSTIVP
jgi:hypothetical protein